MEINQQQLLESTCEWIVGVDISSALADTPGAEAHLTAIRNDRLDFIRTALAATLLDKYEEAQHSLVAGRMALGLLDVEMREPDVKTGEAEPDKLFTFDALTRRIGGDKRRVSRVWGALERDRNLLAVMATGESGLSEDEQRRFQLYDGLFVGEHISLRALKRLAAAEDVDLHDVRNLGPIGTGLITEAAKIEFDS